MTYPIIQTNRTPLINSETYESMYERSMDEPEAFWAEQAETFIDWGKKWDKVSDVDFAKGKIAWFEGATLNVSYNCLDRHLPERADQVAIIWEGDDPNSSESITYSQLHEKVCKFSNGLEELGVVKGDRICLYMPMILEAAIAMLACARVGAIHSVVFGGFSPDALRDRILDSKCKIVITADEGVRGGKSIPLKANVDQATRDCDCVDAIVVVERTGGKVTWNERDIWYHDLVKNASTNYPCEMFDAENPLFILYTSGSTGKPKGVLHTSGGYLLYAAMTHKYTFDYQEGDIYWCTADVGWVTGHSYIVYAPLFKGCTTIIFEGKPVGTPDAGAFWKIISDYKVKSLFTAPTAFRAIKKEDPEGKFFTKYDLSSFESLFLAGERADPDTIKWAESLLKVPVIDHWWQTETSWAISSNCTGIEMMKTKYGSACKAVPGYDVKIIKPDQSLAKPNEMGDIVVKLPLPPGTFPTLWNADKRYEETYMSNYKGYYQTYDAGHIDEDGYIWIMSRTDDIINVAGHRLSTGAIEEVLSEHQSVAECAVMGIADKLKGQLPIGLLTLKAGVQKDNETISKECVQMVRDKVGPVAAFKIAIVVKRLPKTRSGKILRGTVRKIADNEEYKMPATIDDPAILDEIKQDLINNNILKV